MVLPELLAFRKGYVKSMSQHYYDLIFLKKRYENLKATLYVWRYGSDISEQEKTKRKNQKIEGDNWYPWKWNAQYMVKQDGCPTCYENHIHFELVSKYEKTLYMFYKARTIADKFQQFKFMLRFSTIHNKNDIDLRFELDKDELLYNRYHDIQASRSVLETLTCRRNEILYRLEQPSTKAKIKT